MVGLYLVHPGGARLSLLMHTGRSRDHHCPLLAGATALQATGSGSTRHRHRRSGCRRGLRLLIPLLRRHFSAEHERGARLLFLSLSLSPTHTQLLLRTLHTPQRQLSLSSPLARDCCWLLLLVLLCAAAAAATTQH